ncbi:hypothetical protein H262_01775 [Citrobacter freundii GTC 09479]|nr:hypothetical protein H262_01775 [Citrobacter freundii GTC 09479]
MCIKVLLLNAFLESKITQQELANRIGRPKQEITLAARALGKELALTML